MGTEIKFTDLIQTFSDLSEEFKSWTENKLWFFQTDNFESKDDLHHYHFSVGGKIKPDQLKNIFKNDDYDKIEYRGLYVVTSDDSHPQFSQRFFDNFNAGIGTIVLTKSIDKNLHLNTLSQFYILSYVMGMLARYFPSVWMGLSRSEKGDAIYPLFIKSMELIENYFPLTVLEYLEGPYDFEK